MLRSRIEELSLRLQKIPLSIWILSGFLICYLLFFIGPLFLSSNSMQVFQPVPAAQHLGIDLKMRLSWSEYSLDPSLPMPDGDGTVFPPFANLLFAPLLGLDFPTAYRLLTVFTVFAYVSLTIWLPALINGQHRLHPVAVLILATGLLSYGLQFELERGQWNVIAVFLALTAVWIFHRHRNLRVVAYVLFVISVQLKLYPLVFIVLLVSDWRLWRENFIRLGVLAVVNVLLFFIQGVRVFWIWMSGLTDWSASTWIWEGNPSIRSAMTLAAQLADRRGWEGLASSVGIIVAALSLVVVVSLIAILLRAHRRRTAAPSPYYMLAASIGCLLIPSGGYDYRLTILGAPLVLVFLAEDGAEGAAVARLGLAARRLAILLLAVAYATTLFPYTQKPFYLANNFPALLVMLLVVTCLALTSQQSAPEPSVLGAAHAPSHG